MFQLTTSVIQTDALISACKDVRCGGFVSFEGWVRNHNHGLVVSHLIYEAYPALAIKEGERIVQQALQTFDIQQAVCVHRTGRLELQELAVWTGVSAAHREEAFKACQFIINQVKLSVPIWKKEFYVSGQTSWVNCPNCLAKS